MKLNMGCGYHKAEGYINVDRSPGCGPDQVVDLERLPWPWPDDSAEEVVFYHCLEHLGRDPDTFLAMFSELYRVCAPEALVRVVVPHPRHDNFINDPTHVRIITPRLLTLFSKKENDRWKAEGFANTPLAHQLGVDFELESHVVELEEPYRSQVAEGVLTEAEWKRALRERNNVASEYRIALRVKKAPSASRPCAAGTAFLFEPDWSGEAWKAVLLSHVEAFAPGDPVALVFPLKGGISMQEAERRVLETVAQSGRETFPNVLLVAPEEDLLDTLRLYPSIQWVPQPGQEAAPLSGPFGTRLGQARKRMGL